MREPGFYWVIREDGDAPEIALYARRWGSSELRWQRAGTDLTDVLVCAVGPKVAAPPASDFAVTPEWTAALERMKSFVMPKIKSGYMIEDEPA